MSEDTARWAQQYAVKMQIPRAFPASTIQALRACIASERSGKGKQAMQALFRAYWVEGEDISDAAVIERALSAAGLDGKALVGATQDQETKDGLRKNTDLALARGVFGVPTIFVGERSFWGNDRLQFVEVELRRQAVSEAQA
jgi:2-hydroxychromene-2-carboxylate isomerase